MVLGSSKPKQIGRVASLQEMVRIDGLESVLLVQTDRLGQHGIRFQPNLLKAATAGRSQEVFEKLFTQALQSPLSPCFDSTF